MTPVVGKQHSSNPARLYEWARPALIVVSQRPLAAGSRDPLVPLAEGHFPLLRTWESGAIRLRWGPNRLVATGFLGPTESPPSTSTSTAFATLLPSPSKALAALLGLAIGAGLCLALTVVEWGAWSLVMPGRRLLEDPPGRPITVQATDGTRLAGSWFPGDRAEGRTLLMLHGLAEDRSAMTGRVPSLTRLGWNVATIDARASGRSDGRRGSFGARESADLLAWIGALEPLAGPSPSFAAWGRSMGASTALRAAASDARIAVLILEAPYYDLESAVAAVLRRLRIPLPKSFARLILRRAQALAGVALDDPRPIDLAPSVRVPVLILHGVDDPIARVVDARDLAAAFPQPARIIEVPGAGHANVVGVGGDALMARIGEFLDRSAPSTSG